jgi:hypothetical protein
MQEILIPSSDVQYLLVVKTFVTVSNSQISLKVIFSFSVSGGLGKLFDKKNQKIL